MGGVSGSLSQLNDRQPPQNYSLDSTIDDDEGILVIRIKKEKKEGEEYKEAVVSLDEIKELIEEFKKDIEKIKK